MAASFSSSSSSFTSTYLSDAAAAKSLTASMAAAAAERGARRISSILSSADEEPRRNKGKRKMSPFFDKAAPIETAVSTHLSLLFAAPPTFKHTKNAIGPSLSPSLARSSYVFTSAGKPVDEIVSNEAGVSTHLSLLFAGPPTFKKTKNAIGPSPNMARSSYAFTSEGTPADEIVPSLSLHFGSPRTSKSKKNAIGLRPNRNMARSSFPSSTPSEVNPADEKAPTGVSTRLSLHFAGPPTSKQTKNPNRPRTWVIFSSSPNLSDAQFDEGKGKTSQLFDFFDKEGRLPENRWEIKKVLKKSDVDDSSRLLLAKDVVHEHILPHVIGNGPGPDEGQGVEVAVWDMDKGSEHVLVLRKWKSGSFVLVKNWMSDFVRRRGLEKDDEIGLRWDDGNSRFEFTVLKKK
ncbi:UNVERIFIED_CONTAM: putative B3 domain-containing protein [Sesamum radiatum]|uniref:B3 domain-containing protein n=1 Tax=Sesamum radiatum TaxID=300843 RepID=A0AAW2W6P9_SESRA